MKIGSEVAIAATTAALLAGGIAEQASADPSRTPEARVTIQQVTPDAAEMKDTCLNQAFGVTDTAHRATLNPATEVGSGYVGKSLVRFAFFDDANRVSNDCRKIVVGRTTMAEQIYDGQVNSPQVVFSGLGRAVKKRKAVTLMRPFTGIPGPETRGYEERVTTTVTTRGGHAYKKTGSVTVRGETDGV